MGTNYYHRIPPCPKCGHVVDVHIGKSSHGWTFSFHGTETIRSWKVWKKVLERGGEIYDEYDRIVPLDEFKVLVMHKAMEKLNHAKEYPDDCWLDDEGHGFQDSNFC